MLDQFPNKEVAPLDDPWAMLVGFILCCLAIWLAWRFDKRRDKDD